MRRVARLWIAALLIGWAIPQAARAEPQPCPYWDAGCPWGVRLLPNLVGAGVNNHGQVAVSVQNGLGLIPKAGIFNPDGNTTWLPWVDWMWASGINNEGQVIGELTHHLSYVSDGTYLYQVLKPDTVWLSVSFPSELGGINDSGDIAGTDNHPIRGTGGFVWNVATGPRAVTADTINLWLRPTDINNAGVVVGNVVTPGTDPRAFIQAGPVGPVLLGANSFAVGVNSFGLVTGRILNPVTGVYQAFLYNYGEMQLLGTGESQAVDIDDSGRVVGNADGRAVLWADGQQFFLDALAGNGWVFTNATAISDNGEWIVARGYNTQLDYAGDVLIQDWTRSVHATPEPATVFLLGSGLAGLAASARRRARRREESGQA